MKGLAGARLLLSVLALGCALSAEAQARPLEPRLVFRFAAGSALFAAPGLGQDGAVYVGTGDGYLHALAADGRYRWSYTVKGRIIAPALEEPSTRRVFVATSEARLYALEPDGRLRWVFPLPSAPQAELALSAKGTLYFVGQDQHLYGVTTSGALVLRLAAPGARSSPAILAGDRPALVLSDSIATLEGYGFRRRPLPASVAPGASLLLGADGGVSSCENGVSRADGGAPASLLLPGSDCVAPPLRGPDFFAVAQASGDVRLFDASGRGARWALGAMPQRPVWDAPRRRLVLSTATGSVAVLELPGVGARP